MSNKSILNGKEIEHGDTLYTHVYIKFGLWDKIKILLKGVVFVATVTYVKQEVINTIGCSSTISVSGVTYVKEKQGFAQ